MKHLSIQVTKESVLNIPLPVLGTPGLLNKLYELLLTLTFLVAAGFFLFFFPSLAFTTSAQPETAWFIFAIFSLLAFVGLVLASIALSSRKLLVDPFGLLTVLIFALLLTLAAVLVAQPSGLNTFGLSTFRGLAGIAILGYLVTYYVTYFSKRYGIKPLALLAVGYVMYLFALLIDLTAPLPAGITLLVPLSIFLFLSYEQKYRWPNFAAFLFSLFVSIMFVDSVAWGIYLTALTAVLALIYIPFVWIPNRSVIRKEFKTSWALLSNFKRENIRKLFESSVALKQLLLPVIIAVVLIIHIVNTRVDVSLLNTLQTIPDNIARLSNFNFGVILTGLGSGQSAVYGTFWNSVLIGNGVLGILAWIIAIGFATKLSIEILRKSEFVKTRNFYPVYLASANLLIPILGLLTYPGIALLAFWWVNFALISFEYKKDSELVRQLWGMAVPVENKNRLSIIIKLALVVLPIAIASIAYIFLINQLS